MIDFLTGLLVVCAAVTATACAVAKFIIENGKCKMVEVAPRATPQFSILHSKFSIHTAVFVFFAAIAVHYAGAKHGGTNSPPQGIGNVELRMENGELRNIPPLIQNEPIHHSTFSILHSQFSMDDVSRGYMLESVITNVSYSYAMPPNGVRYDKWWKRGAYEDVFRLDLGGLRFPLTGEVLDSLWVYSWGMAGAHLMAVSNRLVATGVPMSAVPGRSQFWSADAAEGAKLLTWENFFLNRDTNTPVSAQLELYPSGNFIARSNNVERLYRRVNPDDWDDDGIPNDEDDEPLIAGEPAFGAGQQLPPGANTNAYCWIDVVVANANSLVTFSGEGESSLADPSFIARAGETNRVTLLIGKPYHVSSRMPITCVAQSSAAIEVSQDSPTSLSVLWPVTIDTVQMRDGLSFSMSVIPDFLGGGFTWTNSCCSISSSGGEFTYSCNDACHCTGCCALGCYTYEGFSLPASGGPCGCSSDGEHDEPPEEEDDEGPYAGGAFATFSKSAVIFEDGYRNTPASWVGRHSTTTELHCVAHGGPNGGRVRFEIVGGEKLERVSGHVLPVEQDVSPGKKLDFAILYTGVFASSNANDIIVTTTFTENVPDAMQEVSSNELTSVKVELSSLNISLDEYPNRHIRGIGELMSCEWTPSVLGLLVQTQNDAVFFRSYDTRRDITCPFHVALGICSVSVGGATYTPAVQVLEPTGIEARRPQRLSFSVPVNSPGGAGFSMELYIMPDTVSFQALEFWERPAYNSTIEGYFTNQAFQAVWYHDTNMCAGVWHGISDSNFWFTDYAQMGDELITPVYPGRLVWHIPVDWRSVTDSTLTHQDFKSVDQTFEMSATGRLTVSKYGHWAAREMSGEPLNSEGMTK